MVQWISHSTLLYLGIVGVSHTVVRADPANFEHEDSGNYGPVYLEHQQRRHVRFIFQIPRNIRYQNY